MYRIAVCDDLKLNLESCVEGVETYFRLRCRAEHSIDAFTSWKDLSKALDDGVSYDVVILDVIMPGMLGTDLARSMVSRLPDVRIVFMSVSRDYAVDAFEMGAVHYVTKPVSHKTLFEALDRALAPSAAKTPARLLVHMRNAVVQSIECDDIIYIESIGYTRVVHTWGGVYEEMRKTLSSLLEELDGLCPGRFFSPYRGYIVNLDHIATITPAHIEMRDGSRILIKRGDFRRIRDIFFAWTFSRRA